MTMDNWQEEEREHMLQREREIAEERAREAERQRQEQERVREEQEREEQAQQERERQQAESSASAEPNKPIAAYNQTFTSEQAREAVQFDPGPKGERGRVIEPIREGRREDLMTIGLHVGQQYQEQIKKSDYEAIEKDNPQFAKLLKEKGTRAYNAAVKKDKELSEAEYEEYLRKYNEKQAKLSEEEKLREKDIQKFYDDNVVVDGKYMSREAFYALPAEYKRTAITKGFDAMEAQMAADSQKRDDLITKLSDYKVGEGYNLSKAIKDGKLSAAELKDIGFDDNDIKQAESIVEASKSTHVSLPGEKTWQRVGSKEVITTQELREILAKKPSEANYYHLSVESARRTTINAATFLFPPAKAALPEYTIKDVTGLEWGIGAANVALLAVGGLPGKVAGTVAGKVITTGVQVAAAGIYTADTVQSWGQMSNTQRGISIAFDTLIIGSVVGRFIPSRAVAKAAAGASEKSKSFISHLFPEAKVKNVRTIVEDTTRALRNNDVLLLRDSATRLKLAAGELPKEIGNPLIRKANSMLKNPENWMNLNKNPGKAVIDNAGKGIEANKTFIDVAERKLRTVKDPARREAIQKALEEAKRQVKVATKEKFTIQTKVEPFPEGKYLPSVPKSTTKELVKVGEKTIPVKELATKKLARVAEKYKVSEADIRESFRALPSDRQAALVLAYPELSQLIGARIKQQMISTPVTRVMPQIQTDAQTMPVVRTTTKEMQRQLAKEKVLPKPQPQPLPKEQPKPNPKQETVTTQKTDTATDTKTLPQTKPLRLSNVTEETSKKRRDKDGGGTDAEKRAFIRNSDVAVTYRRGELQDDVWHTWAMNKGQLTRVITQGAAPEGAEVVDGPGSASKTLKKFGRGALPKTIFEDTGAVDTVISPSGGDVKIGFKQDRISPRMPRLSQRPVRISPRMPRITPRMPKLR